MIWAAARKAPRATPADRAWLRGSLGLLCAQTLVVVASALYRMHVYQEAYGFTRLRLLVDVFEGWLGLLVLAVIAGGLALRAAWLPRFALLSGVVAAARAGRAQPRRVDRRAQPRPVRRAPARSTGPTSQDLSDDAVPVLADAAADDRGRARSSAGRPADDDWLEWNLGRARGRDHLEAYGGDLQLRTDCPGQTTG